MECTFCFSLLSTFILKLSQDHCDSSYFCSLVHSSGSNYCIKIGIQIFSYSYLSFQVQLRRNKCESHKMPMSFWNTRASEIGVHKINGGDSSLYCLTLSHHHPLTKNNTHVRSGSISLRVFSRVLLNELCLICVLSNCELLPGRETAMTQFVLCYDGGKPLISPESDHSFIGETSPVMRWTGTHRTRAFLKDDLLSGERWDVQFQFHDFFSP